VPELNSFTVAFVGDTGWLLVSRRSGLAELYDVASGRQLTVLTPVRANTLFGDDEVAASTDGKLMSIASVSGEIRVFSRDSFETKRIPIRRQNNGGDEKPLSQKYRQLAETLRMMPGSVSRNDSIRDGILATSVDHIAIAEGGHLQMWRAQSATRLPGWTEQKASRFVEFSADRKLLATRSQDHQITVWNVATGTPVTKLSISDKGRIAFSSDGRRIAPLEPDKTILLWDVRSGEELLKITVPRLPVQLSPDLNRVVILTDSGTHPLQIFDLHSGRSQELAYAQEKPERLLLPQAWALKAGLETGR
jgi:WD40 repeat protein